MLTAISNEVGIDVTDLEQQLASGASFAEIADENGVIHEQWWSSVRETLRHFFRYGGRRETRDRPLPPIQVDQTA